MTQSTPTNIGIIGFAHGHVGNYCQQWRDHPQWNVRVVAGWDHDADRLAEKCSADAIDQHDELSALLSRPDIDAVVIAAETSMHADLVEQAAAAGKTIILQKPLALTLEQADRIVTAVDKAGVRFTLAWQMRVDAQNLKIKAMIDAGEIGRVFKVRRRHGLSTHIWGEWFTGSWHVDPELNRGMWADDAAHAVDFLLWLMGKPQTVMAEIGTLLDPAVPDDNGSAIFRYANGTLANIDCSFTCVAGENTTEIVGEKGVIIQNYGDAPSCNIKANDNIAGLKYYLHETQKWTHVDIPSPANHGERISALAKPLADFLNNKRDAIATAQDGKTALQMTLACYDSSDSGKRYTIPD